jgi:WD40 repeat protein
VDLCPECAARRDATVKQFWAALIGFLFLAVLIVLCCFVAKPPAQKGKTGKDTPPGPTTAKHESATKGMVDQINVLADTLESVKDKESANEAGAGQNSPEMFPVGQSPLDQLDPKAILPEARIPGQPKELVAVFGSHRGRQDREINSLARSHDGKRLASASRDRVYLWDAATLRQLDVLKDCEGIQAVAFSPDGRWLVAGGANEPFLRPGGPKNGWVRFWRLQKEAVIPGTRFDWNKVGVQALAFSPDSRQLAVGMKLSWTLALDFREKKKDTVRLLDVSGETPEEGKVLKTKDTHIRSVAWSPDGRSLAAGGDSELVLWDLNSHTQTKTAPLSKLARKFLPTVIVVLASGLALLGIVALFLRRRAGPHARPDRRIPAWIKEGACLGGWCLLLGISLLLIANYDSDDDQPKSQVLPASAGPWAAVSFSPDGRLLAAGSKDKQVWLWDVGGSAPQEEARLEGHTDAVQAVVFAPDGWMLASAGRDGTVRLWHLNGDNPRPGAVLRGDAESVSAMAFSPDGKWLVTGGWDCTLRLWDVGKEPAQEKIFSQAQSLFVVSLAFSADCRTLALGCRDKTVRVLDIGGTAPHERLVVRGLAHAPWSLALAPDGRLLAVGQHNTTVRSSPKSDSWIVKQTERTVQLWNLSGDTPKERAVLQLLDPKDNPERTISWIEGMVRSELFQREWSGAPWPEFSPDGKTIEADGRTWDISGPAPREIAVRLPPTTEKQAPCARAPDGRTFVRYDKKAHGIRVWDRRGDCWEERASLLKGDAEFLEFSRDGRRLVSSSSSRVRGASVQTWNLTDTRLTKPLALEGYGSLSGFVRVPGFLSPDARMVATLVHDSNCKLMVWSVVTGKRLHDYQLPGSSWRPHPGGTFAPDSRHLALVFDNGVVYVLRLGSK